MSQAHNKTATLHSTFDEDSEIGYSIDASDDRATLTFADGQTIGFIVQERDSGRIDLMQETDRGLQLVYRHDMLKLGTFLTVDEEDHLHITLEEDDTERLDSMVAEAQKQANDEKPTASECDLPAIQLEVFTHTAGRNKPTHTLVKPTCDEDVVDRWLDATCKAAPKHETQTRISLKDSQFLKAPRDDIEEGEHISFCEIVDGWYCIDPRDVRAEYEDLTAEAEAREAKQAKRDERNERFALDVASTWSEGSGDGHARYATVTLVDVESETHYDLKLRNAVDIGFQVFDADTGEPADLPDEGRTYLNSHNPLSTSIRMAE